MDRRFSRRTRPAFAVCGLFALAACEAPAGAGNDTAPPTQAGTSTSAAGVAGVAGNAASSGGGDSAGAAPVGGTAGSGGQLASGGAVAIAGAGGTAGELGGSAGNAAAGSAPVAGSSSQDWVGTWATAQQLTEEANNPPAPGLAGNTLRQIVRVSIGGTRLRLRFSNEHGSSPVTLNKVHCAVATNASGIAVATDKELAFAGAGSITIPAQSAVLSDPFDFALAPLSKLAVSIDFGAVSADVTGHPGSRTTSYLQAGDHVAAASLSGTSVDHWYVLSGIDVLADNSSRAVVVLGDSITDGRGSTTNGNDRWPDALAERLQANAATATIGVINEGIGGNAVLSGGLGPTAKERFEVDVLKQSGARWLIVFEGINDLGEGSTAAAGSLASGLIGAYQQFVDEAHAANMQAFGATILPFKGHSYYSPEREAARQTLNDWIRKPGSFDAVLDLDAAVRDAAQADTLASAYDSGDHLHLNPAGYKKLAAAVDLTLFQ